MSKKANFFIQVGYFFSIICIITVITLYEKEIYPTPVPDDPVDVSGNMMDIIAFSKPGGKGNPGTIRIQKRPDTILPFTQEEEEEEDNRTDATLWEF